jgi:hypothetical protein
LLQFFDAADQVDRIHLGVDVHAGARSRFAASRLSSIVSSVTST